VSASPRLAFLVHDIHEQSNNTYAKISGQTIDRRLIGSSARFARAIFGYRCMDHEAKRAGAHPSRSHPPPGRARAEGEETVITILICGALAYIAAIVGIWVVIARTWQSGLKAKK